MILSRRYRFLACLVLISLVGCTGLPISIGSRLPTDATTPESTSQATATLEAEETSIPAATVAATPPVSESFIRIWLPPEFNPDGTGNANELLKNRLDEFTREHPEIRLEVRIKALTGTGGLLESLVAANVSAPLTLPDIVLLPRPMLESAALKGLLHPYNGLTEIMEDRNWFSYANQLSSVKNMMYGLPFAGDALTLAYHPSMIDSPPHNLDAILTAEEVILFPATDPQALFTLSIYLMEGGSLQDLQGRPYLDKAVLTRVLEFEQRASQAGVMPYWLTQYSNDDQVWDAFSGDLFPMAVTWTSTFMHNRQGANEDLAISPLPTRDGTPYTLATGWSWALAGQNPERRILSVQLAEFLVDKEFLASWNYAAGYIPPRVDALQSWQETDLRKDLEQISYSAHMLPSVDMISSLGPALEQATAEVLKDENTPQAAAQSVIDQVNPP